MNIKFCRAMMIIVMALILIPLRAERPFYDSKSWIVNVAGDYEFLKEIGFQTKVNGLNIKVPVELGEKVSKLECITLETKLNDMGYGNKIIDALTGYGKNDTYLRQLALANANRNDIEFRSENIRAVGKDGLKTLLQEDYEPILMHNYIAVHNRVKARDGKGEVKRTKDGAVKYINNYAIFKVEVDKEQAFDIVASISTPNYRKLPKFKVKFMDCGSYSDDDIEKVVTRISKNVPGLALRGTLIKRNPARISIGENQGVSKGDLVSIYRQKMDKKGNMYSKRISRGRVCGAWDNESQINFESNMAGNYKNGDIVVRTPDSHFRFGLLGTWMPHVWGAEFMGDAKSGFTRAGIIHHTLVDLGISLTDHPGDKFRIMSGRNPDDDYLAPMFFNLGIGYGLSKTFLGYFDIMPFFLLQVEMGLMMNTSKDDRGSSYGYHQPYWSSGSSSNSSDKDVVGTAVRIPIGLRFSFNIAYPFKLVLEAGYAPCIGFGEDYDIIKAANKNLGAKRDGIFLNAGFIF